MNAVRRRLDRELTASRAPAPLQRVAGAVRPFDVRSVVATVRARLVSAATRIDNALPDALESMARGLRSGGSLRLAIGETGASAAAPLGEGLVEVAEAASRGRSLLDAVDRWRAATPGDGVPLAAAALGLGAELGGAAARSLDGVAGTLRDRNAARREVRALSAQARASAVVIGIAPVAFLLVVAAADPGSVSFLVGSPVGLVCLVSGLGLDVVGGWWMRRIVSRAAVERDVVAAQQADVIDLFVLALGAGLNLQLALAAVARRAPPAWAGALTDVVEQLERGQRAGDALDRLPFTLGEAARPLVRVLAGAERYGTPLLPALDRLALDARLDRRRRAEEAARRVPVKLLFPLVLCVLPAFGLLTVTPLLAGALQALSL
jgi:Flp pilus assembly protein TadB